MFNKKNENGKSPVAPGAGSSPVPPPQMRKPASIAPLPPKRKEATIPNAAQMQKHQNPTVMPVSNDNATFIGGDILITGSVVSGGEVIVEGTIEGDVRAQKITVKNGANITGELVSEELIIHGKVNGIVRGVKILLASGLYFKRRYIA